MIIRVGLAAVVLAGVCLAACGGSAPPATHPGDAAFMTLANDILQDHYKRNPSTATDLGIHAYDSQLEDFSRAAQEADSAAMKSFRSSLQAVDPATLSPDNQLDRQQLLLAMDAEVLAIDTIRQWTKDPDLYSSGITSAAYVIMKRAYAPAADRLRALIARERSMPAALAEARRNLDNPPEIYTKIALEQIDGNIDFFKNDVPDAFTEVTDTALLADFAKANAAVVAALGDYKTCSRHPGAPSPTARTRTRRRSRPTR